MTRGRRVEFNLYERCFRRHHDVAYVQQLAAKVYDWLLEELACAVSDNRRRLLKGGS